MAVAAKAERRRTRRRRHGSPTGGGGPGPPPNQHLDDDVGDDGLWHRARRRRRRPSSAAARGGGGGTRTRTRTRTRGRGRGIATCTTQTASPPKGGGTTVPPGATDGMRSRLLASAAGWIRALSANIGRVLAPLLASLLPLLSLLRPRRGLGLGGGGHERVGGGGNGRRGGEGRDGDDRGDGTAAVCVVGMDCEMVGVGRGGWRSALARCSIVALDEEEGGNEGEDDAGRSVRGWGAKEGVRVLYDKVVRPTERVVDYRTEFSGITRDMLRGDGTGPFPVVSHEVCRREVAALLSSSDDGRNVLVVGHALINDFEVLGLSHPSILVRDTATYPPLMREGRGRRKLLSRKLSHLAQEELGLSVQAGPGGHCSVEDAATALRLYRGRRVEWERSLGHPLRRFCDGGGGIEPSGGRISRRWEPLTLYLDGCNLPLSLRRDVRPGGSPTDYRWRLLSKAPPAAGGGGRSTDRRCDAPSHVDWIPPHGALLAGESPPLSGVVVLFDGAKYRGSDKVPTDGDGPRRVEVAPGISVEVTGVGVEADDVIVERCVESASSASGGGSGLPDRGRVTGVEEVISLFERGDMKRSRVLDDSENDLLDYYVVVRRKAGGRKTNKKLFDKLHLRRPEEGALCLTALTERLRRNSLAIAKDLLRAGVHNVVEYELRERRHVRSVVITDDVLLADRVVKQGAVVLSYRQMQQLH